MTQDLDISGSDFNVYEFYSIKDKSELYEKAWLDG